MRIAYISLENPFFSGNNGGIGTYTGNVARMMAKNNHEVHVFTIGIEKYSQIIEENIILHMIAPPVSRYHFFEEQAIQIYKAIKEEHQKGKFDLIESQEWTAPGVIVVEELQIPFVTRLHTPLFLIQEINNSGKLYKYSDTINDYEKIQVEKSNLITSPSAALAQIVKEKWNVSSEILPNPIALQDYQKKSNNMELPFLLYIGRLEYRKGVLQFAEVLLEVLKERSDFNMLFCGADTFYQKKSVKKHIMEICKGYEKHIQFISHISGERKNELIENCKAIVVPSIWENYPYVILEAMIKGKTILASKSGGISEIIEDGVSGNLVNVNDKKLWKQKIIQILKGDLDTGSCAYDSVQAVCSFEVLYPKYLNLYESIILKGK